MDAFNGHDATYDNLFLVLVIHCCYVLDILVESQGLSHPERHGQVSE